MQNGVDRGSEHERILHCILMSILYMVFRTIQFQSSLRVH
jgi:hypothetical protein